MDSIVYSVANLDAETREMILELLPHPDTISKELTVVYRDLEQAGDFFEKNIFF
ncbi:ABC-type Mn/Zn transport system, ATPase component [Clostridium sp. SY8519]|uniref:hypothetical protein n=1 Tax=Clostridium sp. (strain SY8519) TaxID=1042156 RepID=UPI00021722B7|nr:hypothetical protein [Clostridium sp. SY8519]BAK48485.1 ABC-type Mn/Zn transport system, ATPase component [Clostridium sp. SY8519]